MTKEKLIEILEGDKDYSIEKPLITGISIIAKHSKREERAAEHDVFYYGSLDEVCETITEIEAEMLCKCGAIVDNETDSFMFFT